jgi:GDP-D-mannose 3',5'-epimerase
LEKAGKILVIGGGGLIGGHLVADLLQAGPSDICAVDCKPLSGWYQLFPQAEHICTDLRQLSARRVATRDVRYVFNLAADMAGKGFIETQKPNARCRS